MPDDTYTCPDCAADDAPAEDARCTYCQRAHDYNDLLRTQGTTEMLPWQVVWVSRMLRGWDAA